MKITRETLRTSVDALYEAIEKKAGDWRRNHLGASIIGHRCERYLWLSFRWALNPKHDGKQLRLFKRGDREEQWIAADLRRAGFEVTTRGPDGKQIRFQHGHVGGGRDGTIKGILEAPATEHLLEIKTHNLKQFDRLIEKGVKSAKPEHYVQMQLYMRAGKLERALYVAICKNDDRIHMERVKLDREFADAQLERAQRIVNAKEPAERLDKDFPPCVYVSKDGTRWPCDFYELCHGEEMPERSCRTCIDSTPSVDDDGKPTWICGRFGKQLTPAKQRRGCGDQLSIPSIINAPVVTVDEDARSITYQMPSGQLRVED